MWWAWACGPAVEEAQDVANAAALVETLSAPGPFSVGYTVESVTWEPSDVLGERTLRLAIWYPSEETDGETARYFYDTIEDPGVWRDASPAAGPFPWVVFSHGHQGFAEASSFLMAHLASHGFVVAAPDHTGNTALDGSARTTELYWERPLDLSTVIDHLSALPADHLLSGEVGGLVAALGHSFGGYTVFALGGAPYTPAALDSCLAGGGGDICSTYDAEDDVIFRSGLGDGRVPAVLAMAPGDYPLVGAGVSEIGGPVVLMTGGYDVGVVGADWWTGLARTDNRWVDIVRGGHHVFDDFSVVLDPAEPAPIPAADGFGIVNAYVLSWLKALLGDDSVSGVVDGTDPIDPHEVVVTLP